MPIYEYMCPKCGKYETIVDIDKRDDQLCPVCGEPVKRLLSKFAVHYKGPGFYTTDNRSALDAYDEETYGEELLDSD